MEIVLTEALGRRVARAADHSRRRSLLSIETHYTLEAIRERQLEQSVLCKDLGGFFEHVWTVHPFASLLTSEGWSPCYGTPVSIELAPRHTFIEGKVGRYSWLRSFFPLNFLLAQIGLFLQLRRLIAEHHISVIRASNPLYAGLFSLLLAKAARVPLVVRVGSNHDKHFETTGRPVEPRLMRSRRVEKFVERLVLSRADLVAGANTDNLDFALASGARKERSTLFRYGNLIDSRHFLPPADRPGSPAVLEELGVKPGEFLLYVGRLEPIKQPDHVIAALKYVRQSGLDVKAIIAGEGSMDAQLRGYIKKNGLEDYVLFPGNLTQGQLAALYPSAAAVVSPHTGRALTEAALGAAPIAAYDVDWQPELIESEVTGFLVPHGDVKQLGRATAKLVSDRKLAAALGKSVRERALSMFDPEMLDENERQEYGRVIERHNSRRAWVQT